VRVAHPHRVVQPEAAPARPVVAPRPPADTVVVAAGSEASVVPDVATDVAPDIAAPGVAPPVSGVSQQYASAPPPSYPVAARRMHHEGTVLLAVLVDVDGRPLRVDIRESSGHRQLDDAAREQVLARWRFRPAMRDGRAIQAIGLVPVNFRLR
jgi:protein TonB